MVNESLAKKYFPNVNPIGRTFEAGRNHPTKMEIVGVCADAKYYSLRNEAEASYYALYRQMSNGMEEATFAVATRLDARSLVPSVREAVRQVDQNLPLLDIRTQDEQIQASQRRDALRGSIRCELCGTTNTILGSARMRRQVLPTETSLPSVSCSFT